MCIYNAIKRHKPSNNCKEQHHVLCMPIIIIYIEAYNNYLKYSGNQRMLFIISSLSQLLYIVSTSLQHFNASFRNSYSQCISLCLDNFRNVKSEIRCRPRENAPFAPPRPCMPSPSASSSSSTSCSDCCSFVTRG